MSALSLGIIAAFAWGFHDICVRYLSQRTPLMASLLVVLIFGLLFHIGVMVVEDGFAPLTPQTTWMALVSGTFFLMASLGLYGAFQRLQKPCLTMLIGARMWQGLTQTEQVLKIQKP